MGRYESILGNVELVARVIQNGGMTRKRQCHARKSGHPDLAARAELFPAYVGMTEDLILNDAPH